MANPWDHLPIIPEQKAGNPWDHLPLAPEQQDSSLGKATARGAKSVGSGIVGGLADTITMPYNLAATMFNALKESKFAKDIDPSSRAMLEGEGFYLGEPGSPDIPTAPSVVDAVDKGVDQLTGDYTKTPENEKSIHEGLKAIGSMASVGGAAKGAVKFGANRIGKVLEKFGSTKARDLAAGGIASGVTSEAMERGQNMPAAFGEGIGAGVLANVLMNPKDLKSLGKSLGNIPKKAVITAAGLGQKDFNVQAYEALKKLGVKNITPDAVSTSPQTKFWDQATTKIPYIGGQYQTLKKELAEDLIAGKNQTLLKAVGPRKHDVLDNGKTAQQTWKQLYALEKEKLPSGASTVPSNSIAAASQIIEKLEKIPALHTDKQKVLDDTKKVLSQWGSQKPEQEMLQQFLQKNPGYEKVIENPAVREQILKQAQTSVPKQVEIETVIDQLHNFYEMIYSPTGKESKTYLKKLTGAIAEDISIASEKYPEFKQIHEQANKLFGQSHNREKLEKIFENIVDTTGNTVRYKNLRDAIHHPKNQEKFERVLGENYLEKLSDLSKSVGALAHNQAFSYNPSSTSMVEWVKTLLKNVFQSPLQQTSKIAIPLLFTSKNFVNLAYKFAKEPTEPLAQQLNNLIKESTGMTSQSLTTALHGDGEREKRKKLHITVYPQKKN